MYVKKRDGRIERYDANKVRRAILMAADAAGEAIDDLDGVVNTITRSLNGLVTVDEVQKRIELTLIGAVSANIARTYIQYRATRDSLRAADGKALRVAVSDFVIHDKYIGKVSWFDAMEEVKELHARLGWKMDDECFDLMSSKVITPSMRSLQFRLNVLKHPARMYNCSFMKMDRWSCIEDICYLLLCGCGVGFSIQKRHVAQLPPLKPIGREVRHGHIPDTIEGWAAAFQALIDGAVNGVWVEFDYSAIRAEGSPINGAHGMPAPGHLALRESLEKIRAMLMPGKVRPIHVHDIICVMAECVRAGGVRRSSLISLFDDEEMLYAKSGKWPAHRAMANNSWILHRGDPQLLEKLKRVYDLSREWYGEPGFLLVDDLEHGTNPCAEIGLDPGDGIAFCNLTGINASLIGSRREMTRASAAAARLGTSQALCWVGDKHRDVGLIGVSVTGFASNPKIMDWLESGAKAAVDANVDLSAKLGLPRSRSVTCVKPSGTESLALGCIGAGVHEHYAPRYFRRIIAEGSRAADFFISRNPHMEEVVGGRRWIVFPVEAPGGKAPGGKAPGGKAPGGKAPGGKGWKLNLDTVVEVNKRWVLPGAFVRPFHNVSVTMEHPEWDDLVKALPYVRAIAFVPPAGQFKGAPYEVANDAQWNELVKHYVPVNWDEYDGGIVMDPACSGGKCEL